MKQIMDSEKIQFTKEHKEELEQLLLQLCKIPAPQDHEEQRAQFCKDWLVNAGAKGVFMDSASNVIYPYQVEPEKKVIVFMAHMDTVFSEDTVLNPKCEENRIYCPGVGDDTANLAVLLMLAKYVAENQPKMPCGVLFVADTGEEGLGNLRGSRKLIEEYKNQIEYVVSFDLHYDGLICKAVGSARYRVQVTTQGGHSYSDFGKKNAIEVLAGMIEELYKKKVIETDSKSTYNVGTIEGGTTINCIASQAAMTYEMRSDSHEKLEEMQLYFKQVIKMFEASDVKIEVNTLGIRPCMKDVDPQKQAKLAEDYSKILSQITSAAIPMESASTDCNVPLSQGIPAICFGLCEGGGVHTTKEWINRDSIQTGLEIGMACMDFVEHSVVVNE